MLNSEYADFFYYTIEAIVLHAATVQSLWT